MFVNVFSSAWHALQDFIVFMMAMLLLVAVTLSAVFSAAGENWRFPASDTLYSLHSLMLVTFGACRPHNTTLNLVTQPPLCHVQDRL